MAFYIYNFESDFDFNKIIIGKKISSGINTNKYYIYYMDKIPKELFIKLPSLRLICSYKNNKFNQIKLPIYPSYDATKKFISFFKELKTKINSKIKIQNKIYNDCIDTKEKTLRINIPFDFKIKSDKGDFDIKDLKINSEIYGYISIPYLWENEDSYGITANLLKLNYIPKLDYDDAYFLDDDLQPILKITNIPTIINIPEIKYTKTNDNIKPPISLGKLQISNDILLQVKNKLKTPS